jgi:hypothetical protein
VKHIQELREGIRRLHGTDATHVESVPVKEEFQGKTVWEGTVEVFDVPGHARAPKAYAWLADTDNPNKPKRQVTVLHIAPVTSAVLAVRAVIMQEHRGR